MWPVSRRALGSYSLIRRPLPREDMNRVICVSHILTRRESHQHIIISLDGVSVISTIR